MSNATVGTPAHAYAVDSAGNYLRDEQGQPIVVPLPGSNPQHGEAVPAMLNAMQQSQQAFQVSQMQAQQALQKQWQEQQLEMQRTWQKQMQDQMLQNQKLLEAMAAGHSKADSTEAKLKQAQHALSNLTPLTGDKPEERNSEWINYDSKLKDILSAISPAVLKIVTEGGFSNETEEEKEAYRKIDTALLPSFRSTLKGTAATVAEQVVKRDGTDLVKGYKALKEYAAGSGLLPQFLNLQALMNIPQKMKSHKSVAELFGDVHKAVRSIDPKSLTPDAIALSILTSHLSSDYADLGPEILKKGSLATAQELLVAREVSLRVQNGSRGSATHKILTYNKTEKQKPDRRCSICKKMGHKAEKCWWNSDKKGKGKGKSTKNSSEAADRKRDRSYSGSERRSRSRERTPRRTRQDRRENSQGSLPSLSRYVSRSRGGEVYSFNCTYELLHSLEKGQDEAKTKAHQPKENTSKSGQPSTKNKHSKRKIAKLRLKSVRTQNRAATHRAEQPIVEAIVDSGAQVHASDNAGYFKELGEKCTIVCAGGEEVPGDARWGIFHENSLGMTEGLYHPRIGKTFVSVPTIQSEGGEATFPPPRGVEITLQGERQKGTANKDNLPAIEVEFYIDTRRSIHSMTSKKSSETQNEAESTNKRETQAERDIRMEHEASGQSTILPKGMKCFGCMVGCDVGKTAAKKARPEKYEATAPGQRWQIDFKGPFDPKTRSLFGNTHQMGAMDDWDAVPMLIPLKTTKDAPEGLQKLCRYRRAPDEVRTDNGPEFQTKEWAATLKELGIEVNSFSPPYTPTRNSKIERFWRTSTNKVRAMLQGVDKRLTDLCYMAVAYLYTLRERTFKQDDGTKVKMTPYERRHRRKPPSSRKLKRFGCLVFAYQFEQQNKLLDKWRPGVFVGYSPKGAAWLYVSYNEKGEIVLAESAHLKFVQELLVANVEHLKDPRLVTQLKNAREERVDGVKIEAPYNTADWLEEFGEQKPAGTKENHENTHPQEEQTGSTDHGKTEQKLTAATELGEFPVCVKENSTQGTSKAGETEPGKSDQPPTLTGPQGDRKVTRSRTADSTENEHETERSSVENSSEEDHTEDKPARGRSKEKRPRGRPPGSKNKSPRRKSQETPKAKRPRGRPPGSKDKKPRKAKTSRDAARILAFRERVYRATSVSSTRTSDTDAARSASQNSNRPKKRKKTNHVDALARDTVPESQRRHGTISRREATRGPEADKWAEADRKEIKGMIEKQVWREVTEADKELLKTQKPIRCHMVRARKRCGTRKSRLVADGSTQKVPGSETYAPAPTMVSMRCQMVHTAQNNWELGGCDVSQASLKATLPEPQPIRLPEEVLKEGENPVKVAEKAIYGLKKSPRAWNLKSRTKLKSWGWIESPKEAGVFFKYNPGKQLIGILVCYVDDIIVSGESKELVRETVNKVIREWGATRMKIHEQVKGSETIKSFEFVGTDMDMQVTAKPNGEKKITKLKFHGTKRVQRILAKYGYEDIRRKNVPAVSRHREEWKARAKDQPKSRKACEMHFTDLEVSETETETEPETLKRDSKSKKGQTTPYNAKALIGDLVYLMISCRPDICESTLAAARCPYRSIQKKMLEQVCGYLRKNPTIGVEWTENTWKEQQEQYSEYIYPKLLPPLHTFADASFGGCPTTGRSTTGILVTYYGTPVQWKSTRQKIVTLSTPHSETVATSDGIQLSQGLAFTERLMAPRQDGHAQTCPVLVDNQPSVTQMKSDLNTTSNKHYDLRLKFVCELSEAVVKVPTGKMRADGLTKVVSEEILAMLLKPKPPQADKKKAGKKTVHFNM